jgi:hypothetical protein
VLDEQAFRGGERQRRDVLRHRLGASFPGSNSARSMPFTTDAQDGEIARSRAPPVRRERVGNSYKAATTGVS